MWRTTTGGSGLPMEDHMVGEMPTRLPMGIRARPGMSRRACVVWLTHCPFPGCPPGSVTWTAVRTMKWRGQGRLWRLTPSLSRTSALEWATSLEPPPTSTATDQQGNRHPIWRAAWMQIDGETRGGWMVIAPASRLHRWSCIKLRWVCSYPWWHDILWYSRISTGFVYFFWYIFA
jgi:hypothetical protein